MKSSPFILAALGLIASTVLPLAPMARAASAASDNANNYSSTSTAWTTGSNLGTGFGAWNLFGSNGTGGFNGSYIGGTGLNNGGNNFGIYSGPTGSGASFDAVRPFSGALSSGQTFSVDIGNTAVTSNGSVGINFQSVANGTTTNVFSLIADGSTLSVNDGESSFYVANDTNNTPIHFTFTYNGNNQYSFTLSGANVSGSGVNYTAHDDITNINQVQFFDYQQGSGQNFGFDNLAIDVPEPSTYLGGAGMVISGLMAFRRSRKGAKA